MISPYDSEFPHPVFYLKTGQSLKDLQIYEHINEIIKLIHTNK